MAKPKRKNSMFIRHWRRNAIRYGVFAFVLVAMGIGLYLQQLRSHALTQNTYKSKFDYGQISNGYFSTQPGDTFSGKVIASFNFNNASPQQMVFHIGYDNTRVEALSVTCLTEWGCYKSEFPPGVFHGNVPSVNVCVNVPNGSFLGENPIFSIQFRARTVLGTSSNWWTSASVVAPDTCLNNPSASGYMFNTIDGSGACDGQWDPCDRGPNPGGESYVGFGPRGAGQGEAGSNTGNDGTNQGMTGSAGGGGGGSTAITQANQPNTIPSSASQGEEKQPEIEPSPFFDGKEYQPGSSTQTSAGVTVAGKTIPAAWVYVIAAVSVGAIAAGIYHLYHRSKK